MSDNKETKTPPLGSKKLTLGGKAGGSKSGTSAPDHQTAGQGELEAVAAPKRRASLSLSRNKPVTVEVKRNRSLKLGGGALAAKSGAAKSAAQSPVRANNMVADNPLSGLTENERQARLKALEAARERQAEAERLAQERAEEQALQEQQEADASREVAEAEAANQQAESDIIATAQAEADDSSTADAATETAESSNADITTDDAAEPEAGDDPEPAPKPYKIPSHGITSAGPSKFSARDAASKQSDRTEAGSKQKHEDDGASKSSAAPTKSTVRNKNIEDELGGKRNKITARVKGEPKRREGKLTISRALDEDDDAVERGRSLAALKRARERERARSRDTGHSEKVVRDVTIPETIAVSDLANRMAERGGDVIKALMKMGVMATINEAIDGDTAELLVSDFGHRAKRVNEAAVEDVLQFVHDDENAPAKPRPPVVTIMGHVDHGKTSLLDAYRNENVVAGEAGGITQHIGAYRVKVPDGSYITFLDTPGHQAFTAMRQRGATATDIVILVVAADDSIMPQTEEAIQHAKAANVPIVVAINKIDKPAADANRVRQELLNYELVPDTMGGDIQTVEVSALKRLNLDKLLEAVQLQAEIMELTAPQDCAARGSVVEAKQVVGRGAVATLLIKSGTLRVGDIFVAGSEWGRVRAMLNESGQRIETAGPSDPVEVLGFTNAPMAGDEMIVLPTEAKAREIASYRQEKLRNAQLGSSGAGSLEQMFAKIKGGEAKELPIVIKGDVQGSIEAISHALEKLANDEVKVRILLSGVGAISESDISLATATGGIVFGFNVRANPQARDQAKRDGIDIRYYSVIYNIIQDVEALLGGLLAPDITEKILGYAEIREVFNITKVGKIAGCMVTEGEVQRGAKVRLLRDETVIYEGALKQLKRHKNDAKEVKMGFECGISLENYEDIKQGDKIECFVIEETARTFS
ncbi:MAG: translation initiation factor IF-2 [Alphaproteobacteria bacterium]